VTAYTLDGVGNITASTDALGNTTTYTYDKMYNMTVFCQALFPKKSIRIPCF